MRQWILQNKTLVSKKNNLWKSPCTDVCFQERVRKWGCRIWLLGILRHTRYENTLESQDLQRLLSNRETLRIPWDFTITRNNYKPLEKTLWIIKSSMTFTYLQKSWCCHVGVQTQTQWFYLSVLVSRVMWPSLINSLLQGQNIPWDSSLFLEI